MVQGPEIRRGSRRTNAGEGRREEGSVPQQGDAPEGLPLDTRRHSGRQRRLFLQDQRHLRTRNRAAGCQAGRPSSGSLQNAAEGRPHRAAGSAARRLHRRRHPTQPHAAGEERERERVRGA